MSASSDWDKIPDDELAARVRAGDISAFNDIVKHYSPVMLGFFLKKLGFDQFEQAQDLTVETMEAAWTTLSSGRSAPPENLQAWLFGTAKHILSRHSKERSARPEYLVFEPEMYDVEDPRSLSDFREVEYKQGLPKFLKLVDDAVESMPAKYRDVIRVNMRDGSTGQALAVQLGISSAEASRRLNEARPRLAKAVGTLLMARTCREACPKFDSYLQIAGWAGGPFSEELRQRLMQHIRSCRTCDTIRDREMKWIRILPVLVPVLVAPELQQRILNVAFTTKDAGQSSASHDSDHRLDGNSSPPDTPPASSGHTYKSMGAREPFANMSGSPGKVTDSSASAVENGTSGGDDRFKLRAGIILSVALLLLAILGIFAYNINSTIQGIVDRPVPVQRIGPAVDTSVTPPVEPNPSTGTPPTADNPQPPLKQCSDGSTVPVGGSCPVPVKPRMCPDGVNPLYSSCSQPVRPCPDGSMPVHGSCPRPIRPPTCPAGQTLNKDGRCIRPG